jgi:hypothetical protein
VGTNNPLAATTYYLMSSAFKIANTYMLVVDGWGYAWHAVAGSCAVDASVSLIAGILLAMFLLWLSRRDRTSC